LYFLTGVQNKFLYVSSVAHPDSYPMGISVSFPVGKAARAWSWPLTFI